MRIDSFSDNMNVRKRSGRQADCGQGSQHRETMSDAESHSQMKKEALSCLFGCGRNVSGYFFVDSLGPLQETISRRGIEASMLPWARSGIHFKDRARRILLVYLALCEGSRAYGVPQKGQRDSRSDLVMPLFEFFPHYHSRSRVCPKENSAHSGGHQHPRRCLNARLALRQAILRPAPVPLRQMTT